MPQIVCPLRKAREVHAACEAFREQFALAKRKEASAVLPSNPGRF